MCYAIIIPEKDGVFMKRNAMQSLINWKNDPERKPLILRGARQVGKTWLMKEFGQTCYANYVYFNFDEEDELKSIFQANKNPHRIIELLSMISGEKIQPGETLILFDEIQECPEALNTLKYFKEKANEYHVVSAGSLLGTILAQPKSYPVGMVNLLDIFPLTFDEFLEATDPALYTYYDSIQKVADFLLTETNPNEPVIPYTHSDVAGCLNLNRVTVSRIMGKFKAEGAVEYGRGTIRVLKRQKLEELLK